ncbi:MAG: hypothetical protein LBT26_03235 [Clostridiales Family XIII bacterium]|jgi:predicted protein tyrosine phosphatase|nr:hypothetical protein [Clostridiales Family XIII bacterium]
MKIEIHGFESVQKRAKTPFQPRTNLISIGDPDAPPPELTHKPDHILRLVFDDITLEIFKERLPDLPERLKNNDELLMKVLPKYNTILFDDKMARQVAEFIFKFGGETDVLICQCEYGQSRSAGCAAAIAEYFYGRGVEFFADDRYYPNKLVYRKVLRALEECEEKEI